MLAGWENPIIPWGVCTQKSWGVERVRWGVGEFSFQISHFFSLILSTIYLQVPMCFAKDACVVFRSFSTKSLCLSTYKG